MNLNILLGLRLLAVGLIIIPFSPSAYGQEASSTPTSNQDIVAVPRAVWEQLLRDVGEIKRIQATTGIQPQPVANSIQPQPTSSTEPTDEGIKKLQKKAAERQDPQLIDEIDVSAGYLFDFRKGGQNGSYYRIKLPGKTLSHGSLPVLSTRSEGVEDLKSLLAAPNAPSGDTPGYVLRLDRGTVSGPSDLFNLLGIKEQPFRVGGLLGSLRGVAQVAGQANGDQIHASVGVETPPMHPLNFINQKRKLTNWLVFGLAADKELRSTDGNANENSGVATYRSFVGRGFNWVRSGNSESQKKQQQQVADALLELAPKWKNAKPKWDEISEKPLDDRSYAERRFWDFGSYRLGFTTPPDPSLPTITTITNPPPFPSPNDPSQETANNAFLVAQVQQYVTTLLSVPDRPTTAVWLEGTGWYRFSGDSIGGKRANHLTALTVKQLLNLLTEGDTLTLRYEIGRDRADPITRKHLLAISYGKTF